LNNPFLIRCEHVVKGVKISVYC